MGWREWHTRAETDFTKLLEIQLERAHGLWGSVPPKCECPRGIHHLVAYTCPEERPWAVEAD